MKAGMEKEKGEGMRLCSGQERRLSSVNVANILAAVVSPLLGLIACVRENTLC